MSVFIPFANPIPNLSPFSLLLDLVNDALVFSLVLCQGTLWSPLFYIMGVPTQAL